MASQVYNVRIPEADERRLRVIVKRSGSTVSQVLLEGARRYIDSELCSVETLLINQLLQDFRTATFAIRSLAAGECAVEVIDAERRTVDPLGRPHSSANASLTQLVGLELRPEPGGRSALELVGLPHTNFAGARVFVASVRSQSEVTIRVNLLDLHPACGAEPAA